MLFLKLLMHPLGRATGVCLACLKKANDALLQGLFIIQTDKGRDSNTYERKNKLSGENFKMNDKCVSISTCSVSQIIYIYFKLVILIGMSVILLYLITHEPQSEWLGAFIVSFRFQQVLSNSKDLIHCSNSIRQRQRPGFHLKIHVLKLQCYCFTLQENEENIELDSYQEKQLRSFLSAV